LKNKILFIDTETGGINPTETSLLSIGLVAWSNNQIVDTKEIFIKHDIFKFTPQALKINKIDFLSFIENAIDAKQTIKEIQVFCDENFDNQTPITLGGHNTNFDINYLKHFFKKNNADFENLFSHRFIDTSSILKFLYYANKIESDISSSDKAFEYFDILVDNRHSALSDAIATANLFTKLLEIVNQ
jgi:DNA polymerase-3 subunit epsilon